MRLPGATTVAELAAMLGRTQRTVAARAYVLDASENAIGATVPITSGRVTVDASADVTRSAELVAIDPGRKLGFDPSSPGSGALYADRFVQIDYGIADELGVFRWTPIFRGPVIRYERSHPEVSIGAQGKDSLGLAPNLPLFKGQALSIGKGTRLDSALVRIAGAMGEPAKRVDCPVLRTKVGPISIGRTKEPWKTLVRVASDHGLQAFYDGAGRLRIRRPPKGPLWTFDDELLTFPKVTYDLGGDFRNVVRVVGKPRGRRDAPPSSVAEPVPADPLSPRSLGRNGVPRYIAEYVEVEAKTQAKVAQIANAELRRRMRQSIAVAFDCLTVPGVEEDDPVAVVLPGEDATVAFGARTFSIGLGLDQMSVGYSKKTRSPKLRKGGR